MDDKFNPVTEVAYPVNSTQVEEPTDNGGAPRATG